LKPSKYAPATKAISPQAALDPMKAAMEADENKSEEEGKEDRPEKTCYVTLAAEEIHGKDSSTFAHETLSVLVNICFDRFKGFVLHPRDRCEKAEPITSMASFPPSIKELNNYF
jgi:hypothetical protein